MAVQLNHTIVAARDPLTSATFLAEILGLPAPTRFGPFHVVQTDNAVSMDFVQAGDDAINPQHYAFLVTDDEFDEIFTRIRSRDIKYWADPHASRPQAINQRHGGRGFYFADPSGQWLEVLTRPYA